MYWNREKVSTLFVLTVEMKGGRDEEGVAPAGDDKFCIHGKSLSVQQGSNVRFYLWQRLLFRGHPFFSSCNSSLVTPLEYISRPNKRMTRFSPLQCYSPHSPSLKGALFTFTIISALVCPYIYKRVWLNVRTGAMGSPLNSLINRFSVCLWQPLAEKLRRPFHTRHCSTIYTK